MHPVCGKVHTSLRGSGHLGTHSSTSMQCGQVSGVAASCTADVRTAGLKSTMPMSVLTVPALVACMVHCRCSGQVLRRPVTARIRYHCPQRIQHTGSRCRQSLDRCLEARAQVGQVLVQAGCASWR